MPSDGKSQLRVLKGLDGEARTEWKLRCSNRGHGDVANRGHRVPVAANAAEHPPWLSASGLRCGKVAVAAGRLRFHAARRG